MEAPAPSSVSISIPEKLIPPIDVSRIKDENGVKKLIKALLDAHGWFHVPMAAGTFSPSGLHDRWALKTGVTLTVEAKKYPRKPTALQCSFAAQVIANSGFAFCVHDRNIDWFAWWLESFELSVMAQRQGLEVDPAHGARMLNAIDQLTAPFGEG